MIYVGSPEFIKLPFIQSHPYRIMYRKMVGGKMTETCLYRFSNIITSLKTVHFEFYQSIYDDIFISEDPDSLYKRKITIPATKVKALLYAYSQGVVSSDIDIILYYQGKKTV